MLSAPRQDWPLYDTMARQADAAWIRSLTCSDRFELYADMFDVIWDARQRSGEVDRLDDWQWRQKLELRQRLVNAYSRWDQWRRERAAAKDPG